MQLIFNFINETTKLWLEMSPYLLVGIIFAGILHVAVGKELISKHLGKPGFFALLKATLIGIPLPVCSCGVIPLASSLKKEGAHKSNVLSFLVSTPTTGVDSILATYSLMGILFAVFRPIQALFSGLLVGTLDYLLEGKNEPSKVLPQHPHQKLGLKKSITEFLYYSFYEIPRDIGRWLILGTVVGGAISSFMPQSLITGYLKFPFDFLAALLLGLPLYVCATGSIPIAASLMAKGFSPGAGLVFLIVGPATNAITLSFVRAKLGKRSFYIYLFSIIISALLFGLLFNFVWKLFGSNMSLITGGGAMLNFWVKAVCAGGLFLLVVFSNIKKEKPLASPDYTINVPDIHCDHCRVTLERNLKIIDGVEAVSVDVEKKLVNIKGNPDKKKILDSIKTSGYTPEIK